MVLRFHCDARCAVAAKTVPDNKSGTQFAAWVPLLLERLLSDKTSQDYLSGEDVMCAHEVVSSFRFE